jgi:hypothetical protein
MLLIGLHTQDGALERPVLASGWQVPPQIWLEDNTLRYSVGPKGFRECKTAKPSAGLLEGFIRLTDSPLSTILRFAQRYGLLGVKKRRDRPRAEDCIVLNKRYGLDYGYSVLEPASYGGGQDGGEPIRNWRFWARKFSAALAIASSMAQGTYGDGARWKEIFGDSYGPPSRDYRCPFEGVTEEDVFCEVRGKFYSQLEDWLTLGDVSLRLDYEGKGLVFATETLFSGLVLQLVSAVCGSSGFAVCSSCGNLYSPARQPNTSTRHYCGHCGRRAAVRDAVRDLRNRRRGASARFK